MNSNALRYGFAALVAGGLTCAVAAAPASAAELPKSTKEMLKNLNQDQSPLPTRRCVLQSMTF